MNKKPIAKGRISAVVEKYQTNDPATGQQVTKNRYTTIGRMTIWPKDDGTGQDYSIEIDAMPVGIAGPVKAFVFMDDDNQQQPIAQPSPMANNPRSNEYNQAPPNYQGHP